MTGAWDCTAVVECVSQTANCSSISKSQVQTSDKAEGACSEPSSSGCPQNVLCMTDDICSEVDVGQQKWRYFEMQWHSFGQHRVCGVLLFKSLQYLLSLSFGTLASSAVAPPLRTKHR